MLDRLRWHIHFLSKDCISGAAVRRLQIEQLARCLQPLPGNALYINGPFGEDEEICDILLPAVVVGKQASGGAPESKSQLSASSSRGKKAPFVSFRSCFICYVTRSWRCFRKCPNACRRTCTKSPVDHILSKVRSCWSIRTAGPNVCLAELSILMLLVRLQERFRPCFRHICCEGLVEARHESCVRFVLVGQ